MLALGYAVIGFTLCERSWVRTPVGPKAFLLPLNPHGYDPCSEPFYSPSEFFRNLEDSRNDAPADEASNAILLIVVSRHEAPITSTRVTSVIWQSTTFLGDHFETTRWVLIVIQRSHSYLTFAHHRMRICFPILAPSLPCTN
jgi:hypothetical protein